jgi:hypothetical protein
MELACQIVTNYSRIWFWERESTSSSISGMSTMPEPLRNINRTSPVSYALSGRGPKEMYIFTPSPATMIITPGEHLFYAS